MLVILEKNVYDIEIFYVIVLVVCFGWWSGDWCGVGYLVCVRFFFCVCNDGLWLDM